MVRAFCKLDIINVTSLIYLLGWQSWDNILDIEWLTCCVGVTELLKERQDLLTCCSLLRIMFGRYVLGRVYTVYSDWLEYLQTLFGKEADSLEQATDVQGTCILGNNTLIRAHSLTVYQIIYLKKNHW